MNYYTSTIPVTLAEKLKEKGMPITMSNHLHQISPNARGLVQANFKEIDRPSYAEVFDWLMWKGIYISIIHRETSAGMEWYPMVNGRSPYVIDGREWEHSANVAIEKTLTLI